MNMKFISGIVLGAVLALGGMWAYKAATGCSSCMCTSERPPAKATVGKIVPDFTLVNQYGEDVTLSEEIAEQPVVLEWFNKDCPYVKKFYDVGEMQRLQNAYGGLGFTWLRIISSAPGKQGYLEGDELKAEHENSKADHTLVDATGDVGRLFGARTTPHMYVIDKDRTLVYAGAMDSIPSVNSDDITKAEPYLINALMAVQNGTQADPSVTEPYGCSVKY